MLALTPVRNRPFPHDAYFAEGTLFLSPAFLADFPGSLDRLRAVEGQELLPEGTLPPPALERLEAAGVLRQDPEGACRWIHAVHASRGLDQVLPMLSGDEYI